MLLNYETVMVGKACCVLVPYRPEHVKKYHEWMQDPHLLEATASEPLTLEEEYEMQHSWKLDPCKCTFIVLAKDKCSSLFSLFGKRKSDDCFGNNNVMVDEELFIVNNLSAMAGDVNLFLSDLEDDDDDDDNDEATASSPESESDDDDARKVNSSRNQLEHDNLQPQKKQAELDIMIADPRYKRKGLGKEASCLMMLYGAKMLGICRFFCKINERNEASLALFRSLGFQQCGYAECFGEVELELRRETPEDMIKTIAAHLAGSCSGCDDNNNDNNDSLWETFSCPVTTTSSSCEDTEERNKEARR